MPYDRAELAAMKADDPDEFVTLERIAERLGIHVRNVQKLAERFAKQLKKNRRHKCVNGNRMVLYRWEAILECAKIHKGVSEEETPSRAVKRANAKRRAENLAMKENLIRWMQDDIFPASGDVRGSAIWTKKNQPKKYEKWMRILKTYGIDLEEVLYQRLNGRLAPLPENTTVEAD